MSLATTDHSGWSVSADYGEHWWERAACLGHDPEIFFPLQLTDDGKRPPGAMRTVERGRIAKALCASCAVRGECLQDAIDQDDWVAIRGGLTPAERRHLVKVVA